jgi:hypothetical protein
MNIRMKGMAGRLEEYVGKYKRGRGYQLEGGPEVVDRGKPFHV